ncbi:MAG: DUF934 domain-containing protein [Sphingopyxis sp.]
MGEHLPTLDAFLTLGAARTVRLEPADDARALLLHLDRLNLVEIAFPAFRDGRGYSSARILRQAGYTGPLRAAGDILLDQIVYMKRCGFDTFAPDAPLDAEAVKRALNRYDAVYQRAADDAIPVWQLRHG